MAPRQQQRVGGSTLNQRVLGRGWRRVQALEAAFKRGDIGAAEWHERIGAMIGPAYLSACDPRAQSGFSGSAEDWERGRRFIFAGVTRDGTFLDVGCANGHLMECAASWLADAGLRIEPYGVEILPEVARLARRRCPQWADRIAVGNASDWTPDRPFDFVRTGLEYVPAPMRPQLLTHLLAHVVAPGGRLIIGAYSEPAGSASHLQTEVANWGFTIAGATEVPHTRDERVVRRAFWLDKPSSSQKRAGGRGVGRSRPTDPLKREAMGMSWPESWTHSDRPFNRYTPSGQLRRSHAADGAARLTMRRIL